MADQDGRPLKSDDGIPMSCDVINSFCERQRKQFPMYYLPAKFHCHSFHAVDVLKGGSGAGGGGRIPPPSQPGSGTKRNSRAK